jgi:hypothetical protein
MEYEKVVQEKIRAGGWRHADGLAFQVRGLQNSSVFSRDQSRVLFRLGDGRDDSACLSCHHGQHNRGVRYGRQIGLAVQNGLETLFAGSE